MFPTEGFSAVELAPCLSLLEPKSADLQVTLQGLCILLCFSWGREGHIVGKVKLKVDDLAGFRE